MTMENKFQTKKTLESNKMDTSNVKVKTVKKLTKSMEERLRNILDLFTNKSLYFILPNTILTR